MVFFEVILTCEDSWVMNSISKTCVKIIGNNANMTIAREDCSKQQARLAVFDNKEAYDWFKTYRIENDCKLFIYLKLFANKTLYF